MVTFFLAMDANGAVSLWDHEPKLKNGQWHHPSNRVNVMCGGKKFVKLASILALKPGECLEIFLMPELKKSREERNNGMARRMRTLLKAAASTFSDIEARGHARHTEISVKEDIEKFLGGN